MSILRSVLLAFTVLFAFNIQLLAADNYHYTYLPKKVYQNQLFPVTILGIATENEPPTLTFDLNSPIQPLFKQPLEVKNGNDIFYTFYFKAGKIDIHLPNLFIKNSIKETILDKHVIPLGFLKPRRDFSGVLATKMTIKGQQVSNYDANNHIVTLLIEAYEANLEDMFLKNINECGIENIHRNNAKVSAEFYAVLPRSKKELSFSYFNTIKKQYITVSVPVEVADSSVTTQSDLNPTVDAFERLKKYALIVFSIFFLLMFIWKRDFFYLILGVISIITLLTFYIPHKKICVKQGSPLYVLPTLTSTISTRIDTNLNTMLLGERDEFKKVEYKKGIIGWVKNEDLCDN